MERDMSMAMVPWLAKPSSSSNMSSILVSMTRKASRMLASAASVGPAAEGEKWRAMDHVKYFMMLTAWVNVWILRIFVDLCSPSSSSSLSSGGSGSLEVGNFGVVGLVEGPEVTSGALVLHGRVIGQGQPGCFISLFAFPRMSKIKILHNTSLLVQCLVQTASRCQLPPQVPSANLSGLNNKFDIHLRPWSASTNLPRSNSKFDIQLSHNVGHSLPSSLLIRVKFSYSHDEVPHHS